MGPVTTIQFEEKVEGSCFAHAHKGGCVFLSISKFSITVLCLGSFGCCLSLAVFFSYAAWLLFLTKLPFQNNNNKLLTEMIDLVQFMWILFLIPTPPFQKKKKKKPPTPVHMNHSNGLSTTIHVWTIICNMVVPNILQPLMMKFWQSPPARMQTRLSLLFSL